MNDNWCALFIATQFIVTPEQVFDMFENGKRLRNNTHLTAKDNEDMKRLKLQGCTYSELGEMYGLSINAVYRRIKGLERGIKNA